MAITKSGQLKRKHVELDKFDPWTPKESASIDERDKAFIRNVQIIYKIPKSEAIKVFRTAKAKSKKQLKGLEKRVHKKIETYYPKSKGGITKTPIKKTVLPKPPKKMKYTKNKEVKAYLENPKSQKDKTYSRVLAASYKYPNASKYELQHGVNSKASQEYRIRHPPKSGAA